MQTPLIRSLGALAAMALLAACSKAALNATAQEAGADTVCTLDGMTLKDFPGPKAQILYSEGKADFYCDLMELFGALLAPEHKRTVTGIFVQDMGKTAWDKPEGHWIPAKGALFVVGSKKQGSMGPTFGAFSSLDAATAFVKQEGGRILPFDQITLAMLDTGGNAHDMKH